MDTLAVVFEQPQQLSVRSLQLVPATPADVTVAMHWSGISTGTERLLWTGRMPPFPGLGYPLVPGYEGVGEILSAGAESERAVGQLVYIAGSRGFTEARGLFGGQASHVVVPGTKTVVIDRALGERGTLLALAATAHHALGDLAPDTLRPAQANLPELIVGHGALGRLIARLVVLYGGKRPTVWETNPIRQSGARDYDVKHPDDDTRRDYRTICEVSGADGILDSLVERLAPGGEITLAGFYSNQVAFTFPPAFMREARFRIAAQWKEADLRAVAALANSGELALDGLITHREPAARAEAAYTTAFGDPHCVKMILDWRTAA
ncbi:MAG TPA: chlorophyll synthesis pathway protein BchC [Gemmatimonas sp.]|nr:chlorophyll synthesis pathway protein BchC [Gemmatimonas sp.]